MSYSYDPANGTPPSIHNDDRYIYDAGGKIARILDCYHRIDVYEHPGQMGDLLDQEIERWVTAFHSKRPGAIMVGPFFVIQNFEDDRHLFELYRDNTEDDEFDGILFFAHFYYDMIDGKMTNVVHDIPWSFDWVGADDEERASLFLMMLGSRFF